MSVPEDDSPDKSIAHWSESEKRLFLITFLGGLAANIGVVLVVGVAIAVVRFEFQPHASTLFSLIFALAVGVVGTLGTLGSYYLFPDRRGLWLGIFFPLIVFGLLCLIGIATGIAK